MEECSGQVPRKPLARQRQANPSSWQDSSWWPASSGEGQQRSGAPSFGWTCGDIGAVVHAGVPTTVMPESQRATTAVPRTPVVSSWSRCAPSDVGGRAAKMLLLLARVVDSARAGRSAVSTPAAEPRQAHTRTPPNGARRRRSADWARSSVPRGAASRSQGWTG